jgi:hypothetical protein
MDDMRSVPASKGLRRFFRYFGSKWSLAKRYPWPVYDAVIEPFAGAAGYSHLHWQKNVVLYDVDEKIFGTWDYLLKASAAEIMRLPVGVTDVRDMVGWPQEARWLVGWHMGKTLCQPSLTLSKWGRDGTRPDSNGFTGIQRAIIASQVDLVRHWKVVHASWERCPDVDATWFVDPPYHRSGRAYKHHDVCHDDLGRWCHARKGQIMVCEQSGAGWLPFKYLTNGRAVSHGQTKKTVEVMWSN